MIQRCEASPDAYGQLVGTWADYATLWAAMEPVSGTEKLAADATRNEARYNIITPFKSGVTPGMRMTYKGRMFNVLWVANVDERNRELQMLVSEGMSNETGVGVGSSLTPAERAAAGDRAWVRGYSVSSLPDAATQLQIDSFLAAGWPEWAIMWDCLGESGSPAATSGAFVMPAVTLSPSVSAPTLSGAQSGSFNLPSISLTPTIVAPSLNGLQGGGFAIPQVSLQPVISAPALSGIQQGSFAVPAVSLQPAVAAPDLAGVQAGVGSFTMPAVSLRPVVAVPTLAGVQVGSFAAPSVSLQPTVTAPTLAGVQVGSIALPSVSLRPVVAAPTLTGASTGTITLPAVTLQPVVAAPSLTGVTASSGISFETDFTPYTASGSVVRDNTVAYDGIWSAKISGAASGGRVSTLSRTITAPASGTKTVERWFRVAGTPASGGTATIAGALDPAAGAWWGYYVGVWGGSANYNGSSIPMDGRVGAYTTGYGTVPLTVDPLTAGVWYRVVVVLNFTAKTYTVTLYDAVGTVVPRPATYFDENEFDDLALPTVFSFPQDFSGVSFRDIMDTYNAGTGFSLYVDKIDNGGL